MSEKETIEKETKVVKLDTAPTAPEPRKLTPDQEERLSKAKEELEALTKGSADKKYAVGNPTDPAPMIITSYFLVTCYHHHLKKI